MTDEWDLRTMTYIMEDFMNEKLLTEDHHFDIANKYKLPALGSDLQDYKAFIEKDLPKDDDSEVFGLHENAATTASIKESASLFTTLLLLQPRTTTGGGEDRGKVVAALAKDIEKKLPESNFNIEAASKKFPVDYNNSMNSVLVQELIRSARLCWLLRVLTRVGVRARRYNRLLDVIRSTLTAMQRAIEGTVVMSLELEKMMDSVYDNRVPELWSAVAYPSMKPLASWVADLLKRLQMFTCVSPAALCAN